MGAVFEPIAGIKITNYSFDFYRILLYGMAFFGHYHITLLVKVRLQKRTRYNFLFFFCNLFKDIISKCCEGKEEEFDEQGV